HTIVANNRLYNSANNRRFWKRVDTAGVFKKGATNISIANEKYEYPLDSDHIFVFNNICFRGPIAFGYCDRTGGSNSFSDIYISNNTCIDIVADPGVPMSLINFIRPNIPATYRNIHISNNIFSIPSHKLSSIVELAVTSDRDAILSQAGIVTANNYWSANPYKSGVHNFISQNDNKVNANLPVTISNITTLNDIKPARNSDLILTGDYKSFITKDFFGNTRLKHPGSNVGAIENIP
ncbi:MAG: hypothetical protein QM594_12145, partial [Niabella sp.]